jgi:hypothetical protein
MKKKRYTTKEEIESEIDRLNLRYKKYFEQAEANDKEALEKFAWNHMSEGNALLRLAHNRRRRAMGILEKKLPLMGQKMAEFMTYQLPAIDNGDRSIPAL